MTCYSIVSAFFLIKKIDKGDKEIIRQDVWRHTVLVLTFTNAVKALYPEQSIKNIMEEYAKRFQSILRSVFKSDISVVSIFSCDRSQTQRDTIQSSPYLRVTVLMKDSSKSYIRDGMR